MSYAIEVTQVTKKYARDYKSSISLLKNDLYASIFRQNALKEISCRKNEFFALQDISFNITHNEKVAILGANGSGKSTLLKILFGIFMPDRGSVTIDGTVGGILELGGGLQPTLTGRENIYLLGYFYGKSKSAIEKSIQGIVEFTQLTEFIDSPLEFYSSGMKSKLAFAIYISMQPDILILDEVFAAGDKTFREKARDKILQLIDTTTTILVSHDINIVKNIATRVIVLDKSKLVFDGDVSDGIKFYTALK